MGGSESASKEYVSSLTWNDEVWCVRCRMASLKLGGLRGGGGGKGMLAQYIFLTVEIFLKKIRAGQRGAVRAAKTPGITRFPPPF